MFDLTSSISLAIPLELQPILLYDAVQAPDIYRTQLMLCLHCKHTSEDIFARNPRANWPQNRSQTETCSFAHEKLHIDEVLRQVLLGAI